MILEISLYKRINVAKVTHFQIFFFKAIELSFQILVNLKLWISRLHQILGKVPIWCL